MIGTFLYFIVIMGGLTVYFLPTMVALSRRHSNAMPVFLLNLYLGFTFFGWVAALIWAFAASVGASVAVNAPASVSATKIYKPSLPSGFGKFLKYAGSIIGLLIVLVLIVMMFGGGNAGVQENASSGVPMSADDMFKPPAATPAPAK